MVSWQSQPCILMRVLSKHGSVTLVVFLTQWKKYWWPFARLDLNFQWRDIRKRSIAILLVLFARLMSPSLSLHFRQGRIWGCGGCTGWSHNESVRRPSFLSSCNDISPIHNMRQSNHSNHGLYILDNSTTSLVWTLLYY